MGILINIPLTLQFSRILSFLVDLGIVTAPFCKEHGPQFTMQMTNKM